MTGQMSDIRQDIYSAIYACRNNQHMCEQWLPKINQHTPVKYCATSEYFNEGVRLFGVQPEGSVESYRQEILNDKFMRSAYERAAMQGFFGDGGAGLPLSFEARFQKGQCESDLITFYAFIREAKPDVIVETGTCAGNTTSLMLSALHNNKKGRLISIDLPPRFELMETQAGLKDEDVGYLIPPEYKYRWTLIKGDAKLKLQSIFEENNVDVFYHDSLHTRSHMAFELALARVFMRENTVIISDDTLWNNAFWKFVETHRLSSISCIQNPQVAMCVNSFDDYEKALGLSPIYI